MDMDSEPLEIFYSAVGNAAIAYVKPVITETGKNYGVFASDGTQLALFDTQDAAYFAAKQHDLEPVLIH